MKRLNVKSWFLTALCVLAAGVAFAQTTIHGVVVDTEGEPVPGAAVMAVNSKEITSTLVDGTFVLNTKAGDKTVEISFLGFATQQVAITPDMRVVLAPSVNNIDELIVIAYGSVKKSSFTGSASVVKSDKLEKFSGSGFTDALQGVAAGVNVTQDASNPGAEARIAIRGVTNMSGTTTPLYIVDGVPYDGSLNSINPNDIESLTVLKDAAASSLYGSRAANGVVIITTKTGKAGAVKVNFNASWGTSDNAVGYGKKADPKQTLLLFWEGLYNDKYYIEGAMTQQEAAEYASNNLYGCFFSAKGTSTTGKPIYVSPFNHIDEDWVLYDSNFNPSINPNLTYCWDESDWDWYGATYSRKLRHNYSLDFSGATADGKTNYFASAGVLDDNGYSGADYYKRYSFNANVNSEIKKWLSMGGGVRYAYWRQNSGGQTRASNFNTTLASPYLRNESNTGWVVSEKTGERALQYGAWTSNFFGAHPLGARGDYWNNDNDDSFNSNDGTSLNARYYAEITLPLDIKFKSTINLDDNTSRSYGYGSAVWGGSQSAPWGYSIQPGGGNASRSTYQVLSVTNSNILSWNKNIGKHNISLLGGYEAYTYRTQYVYSYGEGIYQLGQYEVASASDYFYASSSSDRYALASWIAKGDYNYDNKYYLSASFRRDGSSRFSAANRWGNFWSVGASWRLSKEEFAEDLSWMDNVVIRGSYGTSGNDRLIARNSNGKAGQEYLYAYQGTYTSDDLWAQAGLKPSTLATPDLHWEKNKQWNVAVDFALFGWLDGILEYYSRDSDGLLYYLDLPLSAQVGDVTGKNTNLGNIRNSGLEITLGAQVFNNKNFQWRIDANLSTLKNEVTYLPTEVGFWSTIAKYKLEEGGSLYDFWGPRFAGIDPESGYATYYKADGSVVNSTSQLTTNDYVKFGTALPKVYGSLTNSFNFKGFDFSFMWYYSLGNKMYCYNKSELGAYCRNGVSPVYELVENRWTAPGDTDAITPIACVAYRSKVSIAYSDYYVIDNSYLRLRNLNFGYTLPQNVSNKIGIDRLRVYFTGDNLLTFGQATKYFADPETGICGDTYNGNYNSEGYGGGRRVYMFGVNLTF